MGCEELLGSPPTGWHYVTLGEACRRGGGDIQTGPFGSQLHASDYVLEGIPSIMPQNIGDNRIVENGIARITPKDAKRLSRYLVHLGDIVYSRRGDVERRALIRENEDGWLCGTGCLRVRLGKEGPDSVFVSYYLGHPSVREWIVRHAHGATMPNLNTSILSACPVLLPPFKEQRAIANILGTLDDKIELNRRMSETLEQMARALFKSWFVDFEPVRAKMDGRWRKGESLPGLPAHLYDLFPDRLVDSELGEIPEGWEVGIFSDVVKLLREQVNPLEFPDTLFRHFSIPAFDYGQWPKDELGEAIKSQKLRVLPGVVLLSKLNPEIERVWLVDIEHDDKAVCSTEFLVLQPVGPFDISFAYCLARSPLFRQNIEGLVTGTSKSHQRAQAHSILELPVVLPSPPTTQAFERQAATLLRRSLRCRRESRNLTALRDNLLPKLISGELRVKNAEKFLREVETA